MKKLISKLKNNFAIQFLTLVKQETKEFTFIITPMLCIDRTKRNAGTKYNVYFNSLSLIWIVFEFDLIYITYEKANNKHSK